MPMMVIQVPYADRSVRAVRAWVAACLDGRPGVTADTIEATVLCADEIVTNSCVHVKPGPGDRITVCLDVNDERIRVDVVDDGAANGTPHIEATFGNDEIDHGRGLLIVNVLSSAWGSSPDAGGSQSKVVWFIIRLVDATHETTARDAPVLHDDKLTLTTLRTLRPLREMPVAE